MRKPWIRRRSDKTVQGQNENERTRGGIQSPEDPNPSATGRDRDSDQAADRSVTGSLHSKPGHASETDLIFQKLRWHFGQGADSLKVSAIAAILVLAADLLEPGRMTTWLVLGSLPLYFAGVVISFQVQRHHHRKRMAQLPLDISAGGRFALITAAILLWPAADPATDGLAGRLAFAALILGSASDGAWIALVAAQQRLSFWRAWLQLIRKDEEAHRRLWAVLTERDPP